MSFGAVSSIQMGMTNSEESEAANEGHVKNEMSMTDIKERANELLRVVYRHDQGSLHADEVVPLKSFFDLVVHDMCLKTVIRLTHSEGVTWTDFSVTDLDEVILEIIATFSCQIMPSTQPKPASGTITSWNGKSEVILLSSSDDEADSEKANLKKANDTETNQRRFSITFRIDVRRYEVAVIIDSSLLHWKFEPNSNGWLARFRVTDGGVFMRTKRCAASPEKALSRLVLFYRKHLLSTNAATTRS